MIISILQSDNALSESANFPFNESFALKGNEKLGVM